MKPTIHMLHGRICSGKTTFAKQLEKDKKAVRFSADEWMAQLFGSKHSDLDGINYSNKVRELIYSLYTRLLSLGIDVILDDGFWTRADRNHMRKHADELDVNHKLYFISCPEEVLLNRLKKRNENLQDNALNISESKFKMAKDIFEPLGEDEEFELIDMNT